jgi:hypothetical protein
MVAVSPLSAQLGGSINFEPYVGYGFFGKLPDTDAKLEAEIAFGGRAGYQMSSQWALFANAQRSKPAVTGGGGGVQVIDGKGTVDHWSAGVEFSYIPRGGAEGMLPVLLEAGLGQARYKGGSNDLAVNIGLASALRLSPNFAIRYGANDYISNYRNGNGIVNQIFVRVGAELGI